MTALADKLERAADTRPRWSSPLKLAKAIDPKIVVTPALKLIDEALTRAYQTPDSRLMINVSPQTGKARQPHAGFLCGY